MQESDMVIRTLRVWVKMARKLGLSPDAFEYTVVTERHEEKFSWCVLRLEDGARTFFLKKFQGDRSPVRLRRIRTAVSTAHDALDPLPDLRVPEIVAVRKKSFAILTSGAAGQPLSSFDPLSEAGQAAFAQAGAWMEALHRQTLQDKSDFDVRWIEDSLARYAGVSDVAHEKAFRQLVKETRRMLETLSCAWISRSCIHGDAHAGNFLIDGRAVTAVDVEHADLSYPAVDLANMVVTTVMEQGCTSRQVLEPLERGYALDGAVSWTLPLFLRLILLKRWSRLSASRIVTDRGAMRWMDRLMTLRAELKAAT